MCVSAGKGGTFYCTWAKIETVIENRVCFKLLIIVIIVFMRYPSTYCVMQGSCFIRSKF